MRSELKSTGDIIDDARVMTTDMCSGIHVDHDFDAAGMMSFVDACINGPNASMIVSTSIDMSARVISTLEVV